MLFTELLDHDLHRSRGGSPTPYMMEIPVSNDAFPVVVSGTRGQFIVARKSRPNNMAGVGVFDFDSEKLDSLLGLIVSAASSLSVGSLSDSLEKTTIRAFGRDCPGYRAVKVPGTFMNSFSGPDAAARAFEYVRKNSGLLAQPHACLIPSSWDEKKASSFFGKEYDPEQRKFFGCCRVIFHDVPIPVFFSRPDMVGMYTQFMGGGAAVLLHNVELGLAFCPQA